MNIQILPPVSIVQEGDEFEVNLNISGVTNLLGYSLTISFDNNLISFEGITDGSFISGLSIPRQLSANSITIDKAVLDSPLGNGDGNLFKITFSASKAGTSEINITLALLRDNNNNPIPATLTNAIVTVLPFHPNEVWVNHCYSSGGSNDGHTFGYDAFSNLHDAIDFIAADGIIHIASGIYNEILSVEKNLVLNGVGTPVIKSITINGNANIILNGDIYISQLLKLTSGKIYTNTYKIILGYFAIIVESTGNYVIGNLYTTRFLGLCSSDFGGIGVVISSGCNDIGNVSVTRITGPAGNIVSGGINRKWIIVIDNTPSSARSITLTWLADDDNSTNLSDIRLFKSNNNGASWKRASLKEPLTRSITSTDFNYSYSIWTAAEDDAFGQSTEDPQIFAQVVVNVKVFLEGPFNTSTKKMNNSLNTSNYLPLKNPYKNSPWLSGDNENVQTGFFYGKSEVVDWVLIELRTGTSANTIVGSRSAFIKKDGKIIDVDGSDNPVGFNNLSPGNNYYIVIKHRNHLAIMSTNPVLLNQTSSLYDFTSAQNKAFGTNAMKQLSALIYGMITGDANSDYQINASDRANVWNRRNLLGYLKEDVSLDGQVNASDRAAVWNNKNLVSQIP